MPEERYVFPLRYDEREMQRAVNVFVFRSLFKLGLAQTVILVALAGLYAATRFPGPPGKDDDPLAPLLIAGLFVIFVFVSAGWRTHRRAMREMVSKAQGKFCLARLYDEGIVIETGDAAPMLEWGAITAIWPAGNVWLLITTTKHFIALPTARASKEALEFLRRKVENEGRSGSTSPRDPTPP